MDTFLAKTETAVKPLLKSTLRKQYESQWKALISDINKQPKLRTYCTFKLDFKREQYLSIIIPKERQAIAKFRCSAHHLAIETGRHHKPKVPVECRKCLECDAIEDELHHLIHCKRNQIHRDELFISISPNIINFKNLSPESQFKQILCSDDHNVLKSFAKFLINSDKKPT